MLNSLGYDRGAYIKGKSFKQWIEYKQGKSSSVKSVNPHQNISNKDFRDWFIFDVNTNYPLIQGWTLGFIYLVVYVTIRLITGL